MTCDKTGKVYVTNCVFHHIQVFTPEAEHLWTLGTTFDLKCPIGVEVDNDGVVYVSEHDNHRLTVLTSDDKFVTSFGREGSEPGQFRSPRGLTVDSSGVVYVCDSANNRVEMF